MSQLRKSIVKILVPVSGGKDSQACLNLAIKEVGKEFVRGLFCDTRFEHPEAYKHVESLSKSTGVVIDVVNAGTVEEKVRKYRRFPGGGARFCTDELKIQPTIKYAKKLAEENGGFEIWYGMRWQESPEREKRYAGKIGDDVYLPHEYMPGKYPKYLGKMGVKVRLPILDWSAIDVLEYLDGKECILYKWFDRVGCFPCLASGDKNKEKAFAHDDFGKSQKEKVMLLSAEIGKSIWTSKSGIQRNNPDQMCLICQS